MTQNEALKILKTGVNVFLTGEPGSGKTHTISEYIAYLKKFGIYPAITASTGIAGTHIGGTTIHSWSGIGIKSFLTPMDLDNIASTSHVSKRLSSVNVLIIDEISMLSAKTFSLIDSVLKKVRQNQKPFGGLQVICVGDFFQLPPVSKKGNEGFAFESEAWKELGFVVCYLNEQYRQDDLAFLDILKGIRNRKILNKHIEHLKRRISSNHKLPKEVTKLFPHNTNVDFINEEELSLISEETFEFHMTETGKPALTLGLKKSCLSPETLSLKKGALVMFTKNSPDGRFQNGTLGKVIDFERFSNFPIIQTLKGERIKAEPMDWSIEEDGKVKAKITQIPLRLAWAITVHKSQGMTFDNAFMDLSSVFEYGQGYVALSRVKNLEGLFLGGLNKKVFEVHPKIFEMDSVFKKNSLEARKAFNDLSKEELEKMHSNFITFCGGSPDGNSRQKKEKKKKTEEVTLELFKAGKSIEEISKERDVTKETIVSHLEKLLETEKVLKRDIEKVIPKKLLKDKKKIEEAFIKKGPSLKSIFEYLKGKFSYFEIRLVRLILEI